MKTMKKFAALMMLLCALMICTIPALAANESGSDSNVTETVSVTAGSNDNDVTSAKAMGSGVMIGIACLGGKEVKQFHVVGSQLADRVLPVVRFVEGKHGAELERKALVICQLRL